MTSLEGVDPQDRPQCQSLSLARCPVDWGLSNEIGSRKIQLLLSKVLTIHMLLTALSLLFDPENRFQFLEGLFDLFIRSPLTNTKQY